MNIVTHDGYGAHHLAEFTQEDTARLNWLWGADRKGYVHSISTILHSLLMNQKIRVPPVTRNPDVYGRFLDQIKTGGVYEKMPLYEIEADRSPERPGYKLLRESWEIISATLKRSAKVRRNLACHVMRDSLFKQRGMDWKKDYYLQGDELPIPDSVTNECLGALQSLAVERREDFDREEMKKWVKANILTHFLNYCELVVTSGSSYVPGFTRVDIGAAVGDGSDGPHLDRVFRSIAWTMIKKAEQRSDIVPCALDWLEKNRDSNLVAMYTSLHERLQAGDDAEANSIVTEVNQVLDAKCGRGFDLFIKALKIPVALPGLIVGRTDFLDNAKEFVESVQIPKNIAFLYRLRGKDERLEQKLDDLMSVR